MGSLIRLTLCRFPKATPKAASQSGPPRAHLCACGMPCRMGWLLKGPCCPIFQDEPVQWETPDLSQAEIEQKIKEYNGQINSNLFMSLNKDGSYTGFIKVQLKLVRPVSVPASKKPPTLQDARRGPGRSTAVRRRTSFYLPKDAVKHLHVLSRTRAREVIEALLRKFLVVDDPRKFALFERAERHGQVYLRKLSDDEQPLRLRLLAGPNEKALSFVLKENDSGEVNACWFGHACCSLCHPPPCSGMPSACLSSATSCASYSGRKRNTSARSCRSTPVAARRSRRPCMPAPWGDLLYPWVEGGA
ncbi:PREDICTED: ras association domain-containing protein 1 isoform X1 [Myotis brandtii]|uniref:ras association domain-containing protein 1 isoform X1 n=1 Tax=Myotis brandtii TaxID=109478 RepID=UPI000703C7A1|nr:PREDICTED: ras association domain-containing protein 1 isoform X1 [Myotis brandtii]